MSTEENNKKEELISEKQDLQDRLRSRSPEKDTLLKFICEYGELDFSEQPFCEGDDAVLAMLSYMDMSGLMEDGPLLLTELCERYLAEERGEQLLTYDAERLARNMARAMRYRELKVSDLKEFIDGNTQFCAVCFHLPDGSCYAAFRGTDASVAGWKEDFSFAFLDETYGQRLAAEYLKELMERYGAPFHAGGHSKGGNLAIYAAAKLPAEFKDRLVKVWSNDGPGFRKNVLDDPGFLEIKDKTVVIVPEASVVGMIMPTFYERLIVKSDGALFFQHLPDCWLIKGGSFVRSEGLSGFSGWTEESIQGWLDEMDDDERRLFIEAVFGVLEASGLKSFDELTEDLVGRAGSIVQSIRNMDSGSRKHVLSMAVRFGKASTFALLKRFIKAMGLI